MSLLIACVLKYHLYHEGRSTKKKPRLNNPRLWKRVRGSIDALLQLIGPDEHRALWAKVRKWSVLAVDTLTVEQHCAVAVVWDLATDDLDCTVIEERWRSVLRDWLGETVVARLRQKFEPSDPIEGQPEDG